MVQGGSKDFLKWLSKYIVTVETLEEEDRLLEGV